MNNQIRNDPKQWRNVQMFDLIRQQISQLLLQYPELEADDQLRSDMIEGETDTFEFLGKLEQKRQGAVAMSNAIGVWAADIRGRQERFERREEAMRKLMFSIMQTAHINKAELPEATLSIRAGTPKIIITNEAELPDQYCQLKRIPDKLLIKNEIITGQVIPGAELSNAEPVLSIRTK
jgi:hypothetical protein